MTNVMNEVLTGNIKWTDCGFLSDSDDEDISIPSSHLVSSNYLKDKAAAEPAGPAPITAIFFLLSKFMQIMIAISSLHLDHLLLSFFLP